MDDDRPAGAPFDDYHRDDLADTPVHRRDDDHTSRAPAEWYFLDSGEWPGIERAGIGKAHCDVLDVDCGIDRPESGSPQRLPRSRPSGLFSAVTPLHRP